MGRQASIYEPILRVDVIFKVLGEDEARAVLSRRHEMSPAQWRRHVIELCIENLQLVVMPRLASLPPDQARRASQSLYHCAMTLNPLLDLSVAPEAESGEIEPLPRALVADLEGKLRSRIVGQDEAIKRVVSRIRQAAVGIANPGRPRAVLMFAGPSGVGKTELAKVLRESLFPDSKLTRIDCSEYAESHTRSRLIGAPPGYIGFDLGGQLTDEVKMHPNTVVLLDEVEKAHPTLFDLFLQVFDDGRLTDSKGETVDFSGTVVIMTSNVGNTDNRQVGFVDYQQSHSAVTANVLKEMRSRFRVEFLGRLDEIIIFNALGPTELTQIAEMQLEELKGRVQTQGYKLSWGPKVVHWIVDNCSASSYGARELNRTIARSLRDPVANLMLQEEKGCGFRVGVATNGDLSVTPRKARRQAAVERPPR